MSSDPSSLRASPVANAIRERRLIAVLRRVEPRERLIALVDGLVIDGFRLFEITLDGADAPGDLAALRAHLSARRRSDGPATWVGAGTVRTSNQLGEALDAGAAFGVSPVLDRNVLGAALDAGLPFVPGAYTPTEVDVAWRSGATFVKLFPGSSLGPSHVRELRGPLPEVETMVTGGVDGGNAVAFLAAGAVSVGIGSALIGMNPDERRALVAAVNAAP